MSIPISSASAAERGKEKTTVLNKALIHSRKMKLLTALVVVVVAAAASGLAVADATGVSIPQLGVNVTVPPDKAAGLANRTPTGGTEANTQAAPTPAFTPDPIPAEILGPNVPVPISPSIIQTTNGWLVSDGYNLVAVYAGSAGDDSSQGRVVIVRQDLVAGKQTVQVVNAGSTGALTIANAPTGSAVETSALAGALGLHAATGNMVTLNLAANAISNG
jgi:hypothetical protein